MCGHFTENDAHRLVGPTTDSTAPCWTCTCGEEISRSGWTADLNFADHLTRVFPPASTEDGAQ